MPRVVSMCLVAMLLWACGKDNAVEPEPEPEPHPLVGVWQSSSADITGLRNALISFLTDELTKDDNIENPAAVAENLAAILCWTPSTLQFNLRMEIKANGTWVDTDGNTGTWKVQTGNTLIMTNVLDASTMTAIYTISGQRLTWSIRKADFINLLKATAESEDEQEALSAFEAILAEMVETAEVMRWRFTRVS